MNLVSTNRALTFVTAMMTSVATLLLVAATPVLASQISAEPAGNNSAHLPAVAEPEPDLFQQSETDTPVFDALKETFESGQIFSSTFTHHHLDSFTGEETLMEGSIWIAQERYRVEGNEQVMVVDGTMSRVYSGLENRVIINDYDEETDDFAPSKLLRGVDESYTISERTEGNETVVTLVNDDPYALFYHVEIYISQSGIPERIIATDQVDNIDTTTFSSGWFIPYDNTLFQIDLPEEAERVDLRK